MANVKPLDAVAINEILAELRKAREAFPGTEDCFVALVEEVGELGQKLIQQKHEPKKSITQGQIAGEAVQVATMALRILTEGDESFPGFDPVAGFAELSRKN